LKKVDVDVGEEQTKALNNNNLKNDVLKKVLCF